MSDLTKLTIAEARDALRKGEVASREITEVSTISFNPVFFNSRTETREFMASSRKLVWNNTFSNFMICLRPGRRRAGGPG